MEFVCELFYITNRLRINLSLMIIIQFNHLALLVLIRGSLSSLGRMIFLTCQILKEMFLSPSIRIDLLYEKTIKDKRMLETSIDANGSENPKSSNGNYEFEELDNKVNSYKKDVLQKIKFSIIYKPAIISFIALLISFFIDVSKVPLFGNISNNIAKSLFPTWQPATDAVVPYSFWWLPIVVYAFYIFMAYLAYNKLLVEVNRTPASETIDRIISSYSNIIDSISTAFPLIGAALLLLSIKLGEEVFVGLSVPFEIKSLIILALGKLFDPVLDQLGVEFQRVVLHIKDTREKYFSQIQTANAKKLFERNNNFESRLKFIPEISDRDIEAYKNSLEQTSKLSSIILTNFTAVDGIIDKLNNAQSLSEKKIEQLKTLTDSVTKASEALSDEKTLAGLRSLESIVIKK